MTRSERIIILDPPPYKQEQKLTESGMRCNACNGEGGSYIDGRSFLYDPAKGEHYKICNLCKGTGIIKAKVSITWESDGEIKEQFKNNDK